MTTIRWLCSSDGSAGSDFSRPTWKKLATNLATQATITSHYATRHFFALFTVVGTCPNSHVRRWTLGILFSCVAWPNISEWQSSKRQVSLFLKAPHYPDQLVVDQPVFYRRAWTRPHGCSSTWGAKSKPGVGVAAPARGECSPGEMGWSVKAVCSVCAPGYPWGR